MGSVAWITISPDLPVLLNIFVLLDAMFVKAGPRSKLVIDVAPVLLNILFISITLLVLNLSPKSKLVIALDPV